MKPCAVARVPVFLAPSRACGHTRDSGPARAKENPRPAETGRGFGGVSVNDLRGAQLDNVPAILAGGEVGPLLHEHAAAVEEV